MGWDTNRAIAFSKEFLHQFLSQKWPVLPRRQKLSGEWWHGQVGRREKMSNICHPLAMSMSQSPPKFQKTSLQAKVGIFMLNSCLEWTEQVGNSHGFHVQTSLSKPQCPVADLLPWLPKPLIPTHNPGIRAYS